MSYATTRLLASSDVESPDEGVTFSGLASAATDNGSILSDSCRAPEKLEVGGLVAHPVRLARIAASRMILNKYLSNATID